MKAKAEGKRLLTVKVSDHVRGLMAEIMVVRYRSGRGYSETTNSAIVEDGIRALALKELGIGTEAGSVPEPTLTLAVRAKLLTEYCGSYVPPTEVAIAPIEKAILDSGKPLPYGELLKSQPVDE